MNHNKATEKNPHGALLVYQGGGMYAGCFTSPDNPNFEEVGQIGCNFIYAVYNQKMDSGEYRNTYRYKTKEIIREINRGKINENQLIQGLSDLFGGQA